jgi:hypothetical protein
MLPTFYCGCFGARKTYRDEVMQKLAEQFLGTAEN